MTQRSELDHHFQLIVECLDRHGVDYVVIGGVAAMLHDVAIEETIDVDVMPERKANNLRALANALREMESRLRVSDDPRGIELPLDERTLRDVSTMTFVTRFGPFDVLFEPAGAPSYAALREAASVMRRFGVDVRVASVEDLVSMKRAAGREKDAIHLQVLLDFLEERDKRS